MGQSGSCFQTINVRNAEDIKDGESYIDEFMSLSYLMSPRTKEFTQSQIAEPQPDPRYAELCTPAKLRDIDNAISYKIRDTLSNMQELPINIDKNLAFSNKSYIIKAKNLIYTGQWKEELPLGFGVCFDMNDKIYYEGLNIAGVPHGQGRKILDDGSVYEGNYYYGELRGLGRFISCLGHIYEGYFANSKPHGQGKEIWPDGSIFTGEFSAGFKKRGQFIWKIEQHYENFNMIVESYKGEFKLNKFDGQGTYEWPDGRIYIGEWSNGCMCGRGKYTWPDGRTYEGQYLNDLRHGEGIMYWKSGKQWQGSWFQGQMDGIGVYRSKGKVQQGEWKKGELVRWITDNKALNQSFISQFSQISYVDKQDIKRVNAKIYDDQFGGSINSVQVSSIQPYKTDKEI